MKYIRIEDGVYIFEDFTKTRGKVCLNHYGYQNKNGVCILGTLKDWKDYKQADTIEELCDEIIGILNKNIDCERYETSLRIGDKLWFDDLEDAKYNKKYCSEIYGAIWTDKGLIYVAKMIGKGDLELL